MTQKHFKQFADMIKSERDEIMAKQGRTVPGSSQDAECEAQLRLTEVIANRMANICGNENPRFKRSMFLRACGLKG